MRAIIYARYSSDHQREASIEDQIRICQAHADQHGWEVVATHADRAMSGTSMLRPGYQAVLEQAMKRETEIVLAESLDRLSRDQEETAGLFKRLSFFGVELITIAEGPITELHVGLKGTMNALYLKDLAQKTRRGLEGRIKAGKSAGGRQFGYDIVRNYDANGEPLRGERKINENEADVVRQIFRQYADGKSGRAIAKGLNDRGIPAPKGRPWSDTTIVGNRRRGSGILNCELYVGRLVWNRQRFIKDPATGKRQSRINPREEWVIVDVPDLRIIDDDLWARVKDRQSDLAFDDGKQHSGAALNDRHRRRHLLSGLIKCGRCGANYTIVAKDTYGCATHKTKGTCTNSHRIKRPDIEHVVLRGIKDQLSSEDLVEEFIQAFNAEIREINAGRANEGRRFEAELQDVEKKRAAILEAIEQGVVTATTKDRLLELESKKALLEAQISRPGPAPYSSLHPNLAALYRQKIDRLQDALNDPEIRQQASEIIRSLVDRIVVSPTKPTRRRPGGKSSGGSSGSKTRDADITLYGQLASVFALAEDIRPLENKEGFSCVAGARNQRYLQLGHIALRLTSARSCQT
jgi:site-specific DNA recombinase